MQPLALVCCCPFASEAYPLPHLSHQVVPQGVAARGGLDKGDIILRVNNVSFENCTHEEAVGYLKARSATASTMPLRLPAYYLVSP